MSRIGKLPIEIPDGVDVQVEHGLVRVKGPKGELAQVVSRDLTLRARGLARCSSSGRPTAASTARCTASRASLVFNMVEGVTEGFEKRLEIQGVGYRAQLQGQDARAGARLSRIRSRVEAPEGIDFEVPAADPDRSCAGIDKQAVGEIAARIRKLRPPEPYKGKGVRYAGEYVARKVGKRA